MRKGLDFTVNNEMVKFMVEHALQEDVGPGDASAVMIADDRSGKGRLITRDSMVLCGRAWAEFVFSSLATDINITWNFIDGDALVEGDEIFSITGPLKHILTGERVALNFIQLLSATATQTAALVARIKGCRAKLLDTRKTIPLWRTAQKYAVVCGGGTNHRMGLYDAVLIKENHVTACGSISAAVTAAKSTHANALPIIVEVEDFAELKLALELDIDRIMLDNFTPSQCAEAVAYIAGRMPLEVSGNINIANIREYAETGVDYISVGSITKNIKSIDLSLRLVRA